MTLLFVTIISFIDRGPSSGQCCFILTDYFGMSELQVGKVYFELVDYLEADRAFSLARHASPHSLEGMDVYSTVLYVSSFYWYLEQNDCKPASIGFKHFGDGLVRKV